MIKKIDKNLKLLLFILIILLFAVVSLLFSVNTISKNSQLDKAGLENRVLITDENSNNKNIQADEYVNNKSIVYSYNEAEKESSVFSGLINYGKENNVGIKYNNNYDFGVFIESIGKIKNGDDGKYWQYYVNGILGDVAADKRILREGDSVEWRFEEVPF